MKRVLFLILLIATISWYFVTFQKCDSGICMFASTQNMVLAAILLIGIIFILFRKI